MKQAPRDVLKQALEAVYSRRLAAAVAGVPRPEHIGVMLDGNRRWARLAGHPDSSHGYRAGGHKALEFLTWCREAGIKHVTLFMLSDDNLSRPSEEIIPLLGIIEQVVREIANQPEAWRIGIVGSLDLLPPATSSRIQSSVTEQPKAAQGRVDIAIGYGGRREIIDAVRSALRAKQSSGMDLSEAIDALAIDDVSRHLYSPEAGDLDLIIRTSGEQRLSGFLLWQSVYAEMYFCECYWPDFRQIDFLRALRSFGNRSRRYGI